MIETNILIDEVYEKLQEYLEIGSVLGHEQLLITAIKSDLEKLGLNVELFENYLVAHTTKSAPYLFSAHIDRHGFVKNKDGEIEYAAFEYLRKHNLKLPHEVRKNGEDNIISKLKENSQFMSKHSLKEFRDFMLISNDEYSNVKFSKPFALDFFEKVALRYSNDKMRGYNSSTGKYGEWRDILFYETVVDERKVFFNIDEEDEFNVYQLSSKSFMNEKFIGGQIDNIISSVVLVVLLKHKLISGSFIFTTLEEVGQSYKQVVEYVSSQKEFNKELIILDTSPYDSFKSKEEGFLTLRYGDENGGFSETLVEKLKSIVEQSSIAYDFKPSFMGKTELGRVSSETNGKITGTTLQLPTLNYHTSHETAQLKGVENYIKVLIELCK